MADTPQETPSSTPSRRPRVDEDNEDEDNTLPAPKRKLRKKTFTREDELHSKGTIAGVLVDLFADFEDLIDRSIHNHNFVPTSASYSEKKRMEEFETLKELIPSLLDDVAELGSDGVANQLNTGRLNARGSNITNIVEKVGDWDDFNVPGAPQDWKSNKLKRGFINPRFARYLCPWDQDINNPEVLKKLQQKVSTIDVSYKQDPSFLWAGEKCDRSDVWKGYLRHPFLVFALILFMSGKKQAGSEADLYKVAFKAEVEAAERENPGQPVDFTAIARKLSLQPSLTPDNPSKVRRTKRIVNVNSTRPRAERHQIEHITSNAIGYAACMVHYACSSQDGFTAEGQGKFDYRRFYNRLVRNIDVEMPKHDRQALLEWFDSQVFGGISYESDTAEDATTESQRDSLLALRRAQAAKRTLEYERQQATA